MNAFLLCEGVVSHQKSFAHALLLSNIHSYALCGVARRMCVSDLFNVAKNVLFAHMLNID